MIVEKALEQGNVVGKILKTHEGVAPRFASISRGLAGKRRSAVEESPVTLVVSTLDDLPLRL